MVSNLNLNPFPNHNKIIKALLVAFVLALIWLCCSCSCDYHARKVKKKCGTVMDTLVLRDTVITKEVSVDTIFKHSVRRDTIVLSKDKLLIKYFYNTKDSTVYIQGKCLTDTIVKVIKVPVEKTVVKIDYFPKWLMWLLIALGLGALIFKFIK